MPKDERLPPPMRGARTQPDMQDDRGGGGAYGKLSQLAGIGGEADAGGEEQAAQLVMSAAQQLMQAAQLHPDIQPMIGRVLAVLKSGVDEISGGGIGGEEEMGMRGEAEGGEKKPKKKKRMRPPTSEPQDGEEEMMGGY